MRRGVRHLSTTPRCAGCFLKPALCMCALLPRVVTRTRVVVVMHGLEHVKSTNTGRLLHRCLPNSDLVLYGNDRPPLPPRPWPEGHTPVVLFPVAGAQPVSDFVDVARAGELALVVLDANWRQAARLRKRFASQKIPFAAAPSSEPTLYRLRKEPHEGGVSTFEAVARSLAVLEEQDTAPLVTALRVFQDRTLWTRGSIGRDEVEGGIPEGALRHQP
jgi:DTW domain-containing protein